MNLPILQWGIMRNSEYSAWEVTLDACYEPDNGSWRYALRQGRTCYHRDDNAFYWEEMPLHRGGTYYENTRFATIDEALTAWELFKNSDQYRYWIGQQRWIDLTNEDM